MYKFIINYSNREDYGVSNLKLQKLLYFVQVYFLLESENHEPCFREQIEAWDFGPVVPVAYHEYKQYGSTDIPSVDSYIDFDENDPWSTSITEYEVNCINEDDRKLINAVVTKLADFSATDLVNITHRQAPWKDVYVQHKNNEITVDLMREYFSE